MRALGVVGEGLIELGLGPLPDRSVVLGFGGDAANTAVMAAKLGRPARIAGRVGDDALGRRLLAYWVDCGVDVADVVVDSGAPTGIYVNELTPDGSHRFDYHRSNSAGSRLESGDLVDGFFEGLGLLHVTGITLSISADAAETALTAIERARARGVAISLAVNYRPALDPDLSLFREAAAAADVVFASDEDARAVFGIEEPGPLLARLLRASEVVLTHGREGALLATASGTIEQRPPRVELVDPACAGDALAGAYLAARLAEAAPADALRQGVAAAALSCRARGCALSYPSGDEVEAAARALA